MGSRLRSCPGKGILGGLVGLGWAVDLASRQGIGSPGSSGDPRRCVRLLSRSRCERACSASARRRGVEIWGRGDARAGRRRCWHNAEASGAVDHRAARCLAAATAMALALTSDHAPTRRPAGVAPGLDHPLVHLQRTGCVVAASREQVRSVDGRRRVLIAITSTPQWANAGLPYTLGWAMDLLPAAVFLHVYLAFPDRPAERTPRATLVIGAYATALALRSSGCCSGIRPAQRVRDRARARRGRTLLRIQLIVSAR